MHNFHKFLNAKKWEYLVQVDMDDVLVSGEGPLQKLLVGQPEPGPAPGLKVHGDQDQVGVTRVLKTNERKKVF
jgi:hypothetical protein